MLFDQKMKLDFTVYSLKNDFRLMMPCMRISQIKTYNFNFTLYFFTPKNVTGRATP